MLTRLSNFSYGNYQIANIASTEVNVDTQLLIQIQKYETEGLRLVLGESLFAELMNNLEIKEGSNYWTLKSDANEKWGWLLNGKSYTDESCCSQTKTWDGLIKKVATIQATDVIESMLAPYIFYKYSLNTRTLNTGTGESKAKADNTTQESSKNKRVDAWNEFVQWVSFGFSQTNISLYEFLQFHSDIYGDTCFVCLNTMTYYDI